MPEWRKYFDGGERAIGGPLESVVQTEEGAEVITALLMTRSGVYRLAGEAADLLDSASTTALHLLNLPTARDVRAVRREIVELRIQLQDLGRRIDDAQRDRD